MIDNPKFAGFGSRGWELQLLQIRFVQRLFSVTGSALFSASLAQISCYKVSPLKSDLSALPDMP